MEFRLTRSMGSRGQLSLQVDPALSYPGHRSRSPGSSPARSQSISDPGGPPRRGTGCECLVRTTASFWCLADCLLHWSIAHVPGGICKAWEAGSSKRAATCSLPDVSVSLLITTDKTFTCSDCWHLPSSLPLSSYAKMHMTRTRIPDCAVWLRTIWAWTSGHCICLSLPSSKWQFKATVLVRPLVTTVSSACCGGEHCHWP